jgi:endonuclease YncB( thermonuclease family)
LKDVARHLSINALAHRGAGSGGVVLAAVAIFMLGFAAGGVVRPMLQADGAKRFAPIVQRTEPAPPASVPPTPLDPQLAYPADVLRVIDGDTFEARVRVWPGIDVNTKVRLRNIDAPELHARCTDERVKAEAARAALQDLLAVGGVMLSRVGIDKYGGRVDATVATRTASDVSAALLSGGFARGYDGGRRGSWC